MMNNRYIPYARKYFESSEWTSPRKFSEQEAWLDMIFLASFAEHDITLSSGVTVTLYRGELYMSYRQLSIRWGWSLGAVQRYFTRLAEGPNPRIEKIKRDTHSDTHSDTQVDTRIIVIRLCKYDSYNTFMLNSDTHSDTHSDTQVDTQDNKGYNNKGYNNTHTHYLELKDKFVRACMRANEGAEACAEACARCDAMLFYCGQNPKANREHHAICARDPLFYAMVELYRCYGGLQQSFSKPLMPNEMNMLLRQLDMSDIWRLVEAIANKRESIKGNSLYITIRQWATTDIVLALRKRQQSTTN